MSEEKLILVGTIVSPASLSTLSVFSGYLAIENGKISKKGIKDEFESLKATGAFKKFRIILLDENQFVMPGFVDCHTHAPQFPNIGLGLDLPLLEWLDKYTFPIEKQYSDIEFAARVYDLVVQRLIKNGTTTACYFGSLHLEGTMELVKSVIRHHQRALIGKVSMNIENNVGYYNDTKTELNQVRTFVENVLAYENDLIVPVITPRFAVSCDKELMTDLARISEKYGCTIQSHISENRKEIEYVLETNSNCNSYAEVYDKSGLLNNRCIMAHAVHLTDEEMSLLSQKGVSIAHCPASNTRLKSGLCPVKKIIQKNIDVGLGTDVSGGDSATILDAMRRAMDVSTHLELHNDDASSVNWKEALYLATLGGAKALNLDNKIGNFEIGKDFDALVIDVYATDGPIDRYEAFLNKTNEEYVLDLIQRFIYLGDDRNILQVYVKGKRVKNISSIPKVTSV